MARAPLVVIKLFVPRSVGAIVSCGALDNLLTLLGRNILNLLCGNAGIDRVGARLQKSHSPNSNYSISANPLSLLSKSLNINVGELIIAGI